MAADVPLTDVPLTPTNDDSGPPAQFEADPANAPAFGGMDLDTPESFSLAASGSFISTASSSSVLQPGSSFVVNPQAALDPVPMPKLWKLYASHLLSSFGDRMWSFAVPVLFITIWNNSLFPGAFFHFIVNLTTAFLFPYIGVWVDRNPRKKAMMVSIVGEAICMTSAGCAFLMMLRLIPDADSDGNSGPPPLTFEVVIWYCVISFFSLLTDAFMQLGTIALESDWPAVLVPKNEDPGGRKKAKMSSVMSQIDQGSKLLGPTVYGFIVQVFSGATLKKQVVCGILTIILWNLVCVPVEWLTIKSLYDSCPALAKTSERRKKKPSPFTDLFKGWSVWTTQPMAGPSFAASALNMTVLSASMFTTAWMKWAGINIGALGFLRGLGAIVGIVGSWTYIYAYKCFGTAPRTGAFALTGFCVLLVPCAISMMASGATLHGAWTLLGSITVSRIAMFWFKPAWNQTIQERVPDGVRGAFTGCNKSMDKLFLTAIATLAMIFSDPLQFPTMVFISFGCVVMSTSIFLTWTYRDSAQTAVDPDALVHMRSEISVRS